MKAAMLYESIKSEEKYDYILEAAKMMEKVNTAEAIKMYN